MKKTRISAAEFDRKFDAGEDVDAHLDWAKAQRRIQISLPESLAKSLDAEASRRGMERETLVEKLLSEKLAKV